MSKILIINGSQRKKNTFKVLQEVANYFDKYDIEIISISDYNVEACTGCENCLRNGICNINDEANIILNKMIEADGIIIGSPIYLRHIPGSLKNIFDRGCSWYHRSPVVGKPIIFVTTTQVTGAKELNKYFKDLSIQWGTVYSGRISRNMFTLNNQYSDKVFSKFKKYLDRDNLINYKPSFKQIMEFNTQKILAELVLPIDLEYWEKHNYINKPYFYSCRISFFKRLFGCLYYKLLKSIISKNKK